MIKIIPLASRHTGTRVRLSVHTSAQSLALGVARPGHAPAYAIGLVERQTAIENALAMALYFMRQPGDTAANLWAATARTNRALTLLKQASQGAANRDGRA